MFSEVDGALDGLEQLIWAHLRWCERQERQRRAERATWNHWVQSLRVVVL